MILTFVTYAVIALIIGIIAVTIVFNHYNPHWVMNTYSEADYPNLYQEVLKDYHWSWGKFNPNNYPTINETIKANWREHNDK